MVQRQRIAGLHRQGLSVREIAWRLDRSPSTVSRELRRNTAVHDHGYDAVLAHLRARERGARPGRSRLARGGSGEARGRVEPGANRRVFAGRVSGPIGLASVPRDHLLIAPSRLTWWPESQADQAIAHPTTAAQASTATRSTPSPLRHPAPVHPASSCRRQRPQPTWGLGGRPHRRTR